MRRFEQIRWGNDRLRIGAWRSGEHTAYLAPAPERPPPSEAAIRHCVTVLLDRGFHRVVTSALAPTERAGFERAGFQEVERLHLLRHDLQHLLPPPEVPLRKARRRDQDAVLTIDGRAFDAFWRLDADGLREAINATPSTRYRVVATPVVGYAVFGRAGGRGYLQRLAVAPEAQGRGFGSALILDGLNWLRRRGASSAMVNTQVSNENARVLYEHLGFRLQRDGLAVLGLDLIDPTGSLEP